jgi:hypothetical protein
MGTAYLSQVDLEEVSAVLYDELDALEVEEVWDRAGKTRHGYVDTSEAAYRMVEEVIDPYLEQLKKYQKLGMSTEANTLCKGLLLGLYWFDRESKSEFKNWAVDAPGEFASTAIEAWKAGKPGQKDVAALKKFITEELGRWGMHLDRVLVDSCETLRRGGLCPDARCIAGLIDWSVTKWLIRKSDETIPAGAAAAKSTSTATCVKMN